MVEEILPFLREIKVTELGWMSIESWPDRWLPQLGFQRLNWITTFLKSDMETALVPTAEVEIRPVTENDMGALAEIEAAAFDPLWRHSVEGLRLALNYSFSFDVALLEGRIVGFQYSVLNQNSPGAHLVRITVHPSAQGSGIGSALMGAVIKECRRRGLKRVSLNTQIDNIASHRLYEKFGFYRTGDQMPVWVLTL
jgi:ribosomal protein S18 acetylase RimI-like enzyme